jgi:hypothetical protein
LLLARPIGPFARLALEPISANLKLRLSPGPDVARLPVEYFLANDQGQVSQGELWGENVDIRRVNFPKGLSKLNLSVKTKDRDSNSGPPFSALAKLENFEITDIESHPGG